MLTVLYRVYYGQFWRKNGVTTNDHSGPSCFATKAFMNQHLQQSLVSNTLSRGNLSGFCDVRLGQAQRDLNAGAPVQLSHKP